ncbi:MAG: LssY C-terminal domain-containing protein [Desulfobacterales bacterium]
MSGDHFPMRSLLIVISVLIVFGCTSSYQPHPMKEVNFQTRAQTKFQDKYRVTAAVLSAEESEKVFGVSLYKRGIQPVWLEIENKSEESTWFLPFSVDPDYFSPLEVTYPLHRTLDSRYNDQIDQYFLNHAMGLHLAPKTTRSGFVFTNLDLGTKGFNVDLVGKDNQPKVFTFFIPVPGLIADHRNVDFDRLYSTAEIISYDEAGFKNALENLPCCATNEDGTEQVGTINIVLVGSGDNLLRTLLRSGWNETASEKNALSSEHDLISDIPTGSRYEPLGALYYFERNQDASFRKTRTAGTGRNVLRLWLSPMRVEGELVWMGFVSRDLGPRWSSFKAYIVDIDEMRDFFMQDLWYAQGVKKYGFVKGGAASQISQPKKFFERVSYITDGYRAVIWVSEKSIPLNEVKAMDWDIPPAR